MRKFDLNQWHICDPDLREDTLPQPYKLINEVLNQTIMYKLNLSMFEIQEKKKNKNYEGAVKEIVSQNIIDIENIVCFSSQEKQHNHLVAGDKNGNIYLLDLAKKIVFSKKELIPNRRIISIAQSIISDGESSITTLAVTLNNHSKIYILRYRHSQPKLFLVHHIEIAKDDSNPNKLPYSCQFQDYGRLLFVFTYEGAIQLHRIPEVYVNLDTINQKLTIPLEEEQFKKKLKYPLNYAVLEAVNTKINDKILEFKFEGKKIPLTTEQLILKKTKKTEVAIPQAQTNKKDTKKKQQKKPQAQQPDTSKQQLQLNAQLQKRETTLENGNDSSQSYDIPAFKPYVYVLHSQLELEKKKKFQKPRYVQIAEKIIYGWTNTKQFKIVTLYNKKVNCISNYEYISHFRARTNDKFIKDKNEQCQKKIALTNQKRLKCIYQITQTALSPSDQFYFATGMTTGAVSIWNTNTLSIQFSTDKHKGYITALAFFQGWKLVSGSSTGSLHIDNLFTQQNQLKRSHVFQSQVDFAITNIKISNLGMALVLDQNANLRVYDLWRNQKIAKLIGCTNSQMMQNKGKRWVASSHNVKPSICLYTNSDFTVVLSSNWPNISSRQLQENPSKKQQIDNLINNPWKCKGTNVHVLRNFQILLNLFEGLQNIYKKGYQRKKIQNLFTNIQFTQLYDRNFDIADFGVTNQSKKCKQEGEIGIGLKTHISSTKSKDNKLKDTKQLNQASNWKIKLTNEVLHPEKLLLERRKIHKHEVITQEVLHNAIRQNFKKQNALENQMLNYLNKSAL